MPCKSGSPQGVRDEVPEVAVAVPGFLDRSVAVCPATGIAVSHATATDTRALDTTTDHDLM